MPPDDGATAEPLSTVFELGDDKLTVSQEDGEQIRDALLARLKESTLEDAAQLLVWTRGERVRNQAHSLSIGSWGLSAHGDELRLLFRFPPQPAGIKAYSARVTRQAGWQVGEVQLMHIHARR
jgi:hypothetical protein